MLLIIPSSIKREQVFSENKYCQLICNFAPNRFGFVEFESDELRDAALDQKDGLELNKRKIRIASAEDGRGKKKNSKDGKSQKPIIGKC